MWSTHDGQVLATPDSTGPTPPCSASVETTVLITVEETLEALATGKGAGYRRPGSRQRPEPSGGGERRILPSGEPSE